MSGEPTVVVNTKYEYEDNDIHKILSCRVNAIFGQNASTADGAKIEIMGAVDNMTAGALQTVLLGESAHIASDHLSRILMIPCNLGGGHWVGMMLQFNNTGTLERAEYIDPMGPRMPDAGLRQQLLAVYPDTPLISNQILVQPDATSCGAYTIENLIFSALNMSDIPPLTNTAIRKMHLQTLQEYKPNSYEDFYARQRDNRITVESYVQQTNKPKPVKSEAEQAAEQATVAAIIECLNKFENAELKNSLIALFISEKDAKEYYQDIRDTLTTATTTSSEHDREIFKLLLKELFKDPKTMQHFAVTFEIMHAVGETCLITTVESIAIAHAEIAQTITTPKTPDLHKLHTVHNQTTAHLHQLHELKEIVAPNQNLITATPDNQEQPKLSSNLDNLKHLLIRTISYISEFLNQLRTRITGTAKPPVILSNIQPISQDQNQKSDNSSTQKLKKP